MIPETGGIMTKVVKKDQVCFGHTVEEKADGTEFETCNVIVHDEYEKLVASGGCDTFECPFYKPHGLKDCVRIGDEIFPLVEEKE